MRLQLDTGITGTGVAGAGETGQTAAVDGARGGSGRLRTGLGGDSIQISGPSSLLSRLSADHATRLQQLALQVQSGSYQVSSAQISHALIDHSLSGVTGTDETAMRRW